MIKRIDEWLDKSDKKLINRLVFLLMLFLYVLVFYVIASSGYSADDLSNSNSLGLKYLPGENVWELTSRFAKVWMEAGRFFPFSDYCYLLYYFVPSVLAYKCLIILFTYIDCLLAGICVKKISQSRAAGYLTMLLFPLATQLTSEFDSGLYCFHMLVQMTFFWILLSLICTLAFIDRIKRAEEEKNNGKSESAAGKVITIIFWILSGLFLFMALGTYEVAFVMVAFIGLGVWGYTGKFLKTLKYLIPDFIAYAACIVINIILKMGASDGYGGTTISLNFQAVFITFLKQIYSTIPLARTFYITLSEEFPYEKELFLGAFSWTDIVMVLAFIALLYILVRQLRKNKMEGRKLLFLFLSGLSLLVFPACLVAITEKYQAELLWGQGHLCTLVQSFGLAILLVCLVAFIINKCSRKLSNIIIIILACIAVPVLIIQEMDARCSVILKNVSYKDQMDNVCNAIDAGLYDDLTYEDTIVGLSNNYYDFMSSSEFYSKYAGRAMNVLGGDNLTDDDYSKLENALKAGRLYASSSYSNNGYEFVCLAKVTEIEKDKNASSGYIFYAEEVRVYLSMNSGEMLTLLYKDTDVEKTITKDASDFDNKGKVQINITGSRIDVSSFWAG